MKFRIPWRSKASIEYAVDDELQFHLDMRTVELVAGGMPEAEARTAAVREFGDIELTRRVCKSEDLRAERRVRIAAEHVLRLHCGDVAQNLRELRRIDRCAGCGVFREPQGEHLGGVH